MRSGRGFSTSGSPGKIFEMAELPDNEKATHKLVKYERTSDYPGKACGDCRHVIEATKGTRCQIVKDPIYLTGWCEKFEKGK